MLWGPRTTDDGLSDVQVGLAEVLHKAKGGVLGQCLSRTTAVETQGKGSVLVAQQQWKHKARAVS